MSDSKHHYLSEAWLLKYLLDLQSRFYTRLVDPPELNLLGRVGDEKSDDRHFKIKI